MNPDLKRAEEVPSYKGFDIPYRALYWVLAIVLATTAVYALVVWPMVEGLVGLTDRKEAEQAGPAVEASRPAGALLQQHPELEYEAFAVQQQRAVDSFGWKDREAGIARVPLERAKELTLARGMAPLASVATGAPTASTAEEPPAEH